MSAWSKVSGCGCANAISLARSSFQAIGVAQASGRLIYSAVPLDKRSRETGPWWTGLHELGSHQGGFHPSSLATEIRLAAAVALLPAQPLLAMRRVYQLPRLARHDSDASCLRPSEKRVCDASYIKSKSLWD